MLKVYTSCGEMVGHVGLSDLHGPFGHGRFFEGSAGPLTSESIMIRY